MKHSFLISSLLISTSLVTASDNINTDDLNRHSHHAVQPPLGKVKLERLKLERDVTRYSHEEDINHNGIDIHLAPFLKTSGKAMTKIGTAIHHPEITLAGEVVEIIGELIPDPIHIPTPAYHSVPNLPEDEFQYDKLVHHRKK